MSQRKTLGAPLTGTEVKVIRLIAQGYRCAAIAAQLRISANTARTHIENIKDATGLRSQTLVALYALKEGLVTLEDIDLTAHTVDRAKCGTVEAKVMQ